jgi:molybdopterin/thiamine biosynthesis adenylyltransferase
MDHTRHAGIFNASNLSVSMIGAGGIGAISTIVLAKMGVALIEIWDDDTVDEINIATQFHRVSDIGNNKTSAMHGSIAAYCGPDTEVISTFGRATKDTNFYSDIVISAVDSINARKDIWEAVKISRPDWYLDARMSSEIFQLFVINMKDEQSVEMYNDQLAQVSEESVSDEPCTSKATIYTAAMAAGHIGRAVRLIATNDFDKLPYLTVHNILHNNLFSV